MADSGWKIETLCASLNHSLGSAMDFTYIVAAFLSVVVGAVAGSLFILLKGLSFWRLLAVSVPAAIVIDFALLIDWSRMEQMTTVLLLTDFAFFTLYSLVGCSLGALPLLAGRQLYRRLRKPSIS
jgi:hypothetical protein